MFKIYIKWLFVHFLNLLKEEGTKPTIVRKGPPCQYVIAVVAVKGGCPNRYRVILLFSSLICFIRFCSSIYYSLFFMLCSLLTIVPNLMMSYIIITKKCFSELYITRGLTCTLKKQTSSRPTASLTHTYYLVIVTCR